MTWRCGHGHEHESYPGAEACIARHAHAQQIDPYDVPARYIVHEAGEVQPDGSQACQHCGFALLGPAPASVDRGRWGFGRGRRVIQGPTCTFLVTADRLLAADERPCR
jgi:hypothetical protein